MTDPKPLKIGITAFFQFSFFSSGLATTSFSLADALKNLGHTVIFVNTNDKADWYEDCQSLKELYERRNLVEWDEKHYEQLDICLDIDGFLLPTKRRKIGKKVIVFYRKPVCINEMEKTVYPIQQPVRNIQECDAIWTWEQFGTQDTHILELLSQKPVFRIPYTWSSSAIESHSMGISSWEQTSSTVSTDAPWICHITESNGTMASNLTLPIVQIAYIKTHNTVPIKQVFIHNSQNIEAQTYFKENVMNHCKRDDLETIYVGRQRITEWRSHPKSFVLSHIRFMDRKPYLFDIVWNGIPVIHNSPFLKSIGLGLERLWYSDNSIKGASKAMDQMVEDYKSGSGIFAVGRLAEIRSALKRVFNPIQYRDAWNAGIYFTPNTNPLPLSIPLPIKPVEPIYSKTDLVVGFSDMWQDANSTYNFWTLLLQEACPSLKVKGVAITDANVSTPIDLLFFAPFGTTWTRVPASVPKVHITGENTSSVSGPGVYLNLGFESTNIEKGVYRFPLWIQYIDWFGANQERLNNPKAMPIDSVSKISTDLLHKKNKFCAFVVSNPSNTIRNNAFHQLSQYKQVDSAGRLYNTVGDVLFVQNAGGGGGELKKWEFLKAYKFCITYENSQKSGYVTEKLLAAKAAGCIPIYWGAEDVSQDFPEGSFLNANNFKNPQDLIEAVKSIDESDTLWNQMASIPPVSVEKERKRLAEVAAHILKPILGSSFEIPKTLGATSSANADMLRIKREENENDMLDQPLDQHAWNGTCLLVTFATQQYIQSLLQWLNSAKLYASDDSKKRIRVYLGEDVSDTQLSLFRSDHSEVEFKRIPASYKVPGFPDLWNPQHFAWKLWIYQTLVQEASLQNTLIWYMDVASIIVRWPESWFSIVKRDSICVLEDKEQKNDQWCHEVFCKRLNVTADELATQQIWAGGMAFLGGAKQPWNLFKEAWVYGQERDVIVGPKWAGIRPDGKHHGHRHDQSILSILRLRYKLSTFPLDQVYNHESLRRTFKSGAALYVHRGLPKEHENFSPRIGEVHIINLARRSDRITRFKENHETWAKQVCLRPAYDGKKLHLTPNLAKLFAPNDFLWKKAIMGCALSHLSLWIELANEPASCENYLVLEDDVLFQPKWLDTWNEASKTIPADYDVLYLGGVLPPNKEIFQQVLEPVTEYWSRIKENQMFGQQTPSRYFHFCNYAYILSRKGAQKILEGIKASGGYTTSADHMICNRIDTMKHYVITPLLAGCYQDEDPKYQTSAFNNFNRVDRFDSDLWNNDERFSEDTIRTAITAGESNIDIMKLLEDAKPATIASESSISETVTQPTTRQNRFYTVGNHYIDSVAQLEAKWLRVCFGSEFDSRGILDETHEPLDNTPIFIVTRDYLRKYITIFQRYEALEKSFSAIHISDEFGSDPIEWYSYKSCKAVIRNYMRQDCVSMDHVYILPLGPSRFTTDTKDLSERTNIWSFFGTNWHNRQQDMSPISNIMPHKCIYYKEWLDPEHLTPSSYSAELLNSVFIPCPKGQNLETFRFWEALEHGAIPIYVREPGDNLYFTFISSHLPLISLPSWKHASDFMQTLVQNKPTLLQYRTTMLEKWNMWKQTIQKECKSRLCII